MNREARNTHSSSPEKIALLPLWLFPFYSGNIIKQLQRNRKIAGSYSWYMMHNATTINGKTKSKIENSIFDIIWICNVMGDISLK